MTYDQLIGEIEQANRVCNDKCSQARAERDAKHRLLQGACEQLGHIFRHSNNPYDVRRCRVCAICDTAEA